MQNPRFILGILSLLGLFTSGYIMYDRYQNEQLWGYWTCLFLCSFWGIIIAALWQRYRLRWLALATLSGVLLAAAFQMLPLAWLGFVGFVPLLWVQKELLEAQKTAEKPLKMLPYAFHAFVIWNLGATFWVGNAGLVAGMIANFLNAYFMALVFVLAQRFDKISWLNSRIAPRLWVLPILWIGFERAHLDWELSWPWLTLGNAFCTMTDFVQWYEYSGTLGGTLWILISNILIFNFLDKKTNQQKTGKSIFIWAILSAALVGFSYYLKFANIIFKGKYANIVAVQPNYEPHYEKFNRQKYPPSVQFQKYMRLTASQVDSMTDYVLFPETSFDLDDVATWENHEISTNIYQFSEKYPHLHFILGVDAYKIYGNTAPETRDEGMRLRQAKQGFYWENYNAATQIVAGQEKMPLYKKSKLVPGPENLPYSKALSVLKPLFKQFGGTVGGLGSQPMRDVFWHKNGEIGVAPIICYESIYGDYCRGYVLNGANVLTVLTNDAWWDDTQGYQQHAAFGKLRAIELRRSVVRSANTGTSCFISPLGEVSQPTKYGEDAAIKAAVLLRSDITFFAKYGDIIGLFGLYASALLVFVLIFTTFLRRK